MKVLLANEDTKFINALKKLLKVHRLDQIDTADEPDKLNQLFADNTYDLAVIGATFSGVSIWESLKIQDNKTHIIITSPKPDHAYAAIKNRAGHYFLEPLNTEEFSDALNDLIKINSIAPDKANAGQTRSYKKRFLVKIGDKLKSIPTSDIAYIFAEGKIVYLVTASANRRFIVDSRMDELESSLLDPDYFFRITRKYIVHIDAIDESRTYINSRLKLVLKMPCDHELIVSREKVAAFKGWLNL